MFSAIGSTLGLVLIIGTLGAARHHPRILGGEDAKIQFFPYQVSLRALGDHFCGGSIISERHILTAAHCLEYYEILKEFLTVHTATDKANKRGNVHIIESVHVHPNWSFVDEQGYPNDIAVITLKDSIVFDKYQNKISLPTHQPENHEKAYVTGWGSTTNAVDAETPNVLQKLRVMLVTSDKCKQLITHPVTEKHVCAFRTLGEGPCHGDSGGPLVAKNELVGIVSFADKDDCAAGVPDVYTNVYAYKDFIESVINE